MRVFFATGNEHKFKEAKAILEKFGINVEKAEVEMVEIQGTLEEIAVHKAKQAYSTLKSPVFVEDTGFFLLSLKFPFPGPYGKYFIKAYTKEGIVRCHKGEEARYETVVAFAHSQGIEVFKGTLEGKIADYVARGEGFDYDFIFIPKGHQKTLAELGIDVKNEISSRRRALEKLAEHLLSQH